MFCFFIPDEGIFACSRRRGKQKVRVYTPLKFGLRSRFVARALGVQTGETYQVTTGRARVSVELGPAWTTETLQKLRLL